jgi:hypothetical protein
MTNTTHKPLHDSPFAALSAEGDIDYAKGARP